MKRHGSQPVVIDSDLEERFQKALSQRPNDPVKLAAWDVENDDLLSDYHRAVELAKAQRRRHSSERARWRRRAVAVVAAVVVVVGGIVYWASQPSQDEIRSQKNQHLAAACDAYYSRTQHFKLVGEQIDLLDNDEGGWLDLYTQGSTPSVGGLDLSPRQLRAGSIGRAQVNNEDYVFSDVLGIVEPALLVRRGDMLVLTLFGDPSGYGQLPHALLQSKTTSTVTVQGGQLSPVCWQ